MTHFNLLLKSGALALLLGLPAALPHAPPPVANTIPFDAVSMTIEVNSTDLDAGVILFSDTEEKLKHVMIQDPSGNVIYEMTSSDSQGLGLTEMSSETSEPDITSAFVAYPEGDYTFTGEAFDGTLLSSVATLSHSVPAAPEVTKPESDATVNIGHAVVEWTLDEAVDHYWIELEQEDPPVDFTVVLEPGVHKFKIPKQVLLKGGSYTVGVGAVGSNGNVTVSEVDFDVK